jgi:hypothetical protein
MRFACSLFTSVLICSFLFSQDLDPNRDHHPLQLKYEATQMGPQKIRLTVQFDQNPKYDINRKPEPKLDIVKNGTSVIGSKIVPADVPASKNTAQYYRKLSPVTITVDKTTGMQARFTYFFCSKKDGFCARKIDTVELLLP